MTRETFWHRRLAALRTVAPVAGLVVLPVIVWVFWLETAYSGGDIAVDFGTYYRDAMAHRGEGALSGQPPLIGLLVLPLTFLGRTPAEVIAVLVVFACVPATLAVMGVRDWRVYGAALWWAPVYSAVQTANVTLILVLGTALVWRFRDREVLTGAAAAAVIALKIFLWPLAVWLAATRRWLAVAVVACLGVLGAGAAIGIVGSPGPIWDGLVNGVSMFGARSYSVIGMLVEAGLDRDVASVLAWAGGAVVLGLAALTAWRGREELSFGLAIFAALALTPVLFPSYFCVLLVLMALTTPRFHVVWLAPIPLWFCSPDFPTPVERLVFLAVATVLVGWLVRQLTRATTTSSARSSTSVPGRRSSPRVMSSSVSGSSTSNA